MNEPLTKKNIMHFTDGAYLTGDYIMPKRIESALDGLQDDMVERGHEEFRAIEMIGLIRKWFPIFNQE